MKPRAPSAASRKTVSAANLAALGAERLAALLMNLAEGKPDIKRRLKLELLGEIGGDSVVAEIEKRLATLEKTRSRIDSRKARDFVRDLDALRAAIAERVGASDPKQALELMWRFLGLQATVVSRFYDDGAGILACYRRACEDIGALAQRGEPDRRQLATRIHAAIIADTHGLSSALPGQLAPALGQEGLALLRGLFRRDLDKLAGRGTNAAWSSRRLLATLRDIADIEGDIEAYKAAVPADARLLFAPAVARRLTAAGKAAQAVRYLEEARAAETRVRVSFNTDYMMVVGEPSYEEALTAALDASGAADKAQALRWRAFDERLAVQPLRDYLKRLPDFDDIEAEEKAFEVAAHHHVLSQAIAFFSQWPAPARLAALVEERQGTLNGNDYEVLNVAAAVLSEHFPRAASLVLRAMILDTLVGSKSQRYRYGAQALKRCADLSAEVSDWGPFQSHPDFLADLRKNHGRKYGFWAEVDSAK